MEFKWTVYAEGYTINSIGEWEPYRGGDWPVSTTSDHVDDLISETEAMVIDLGLYEADVSMFPVIDGEPHFNLSFRVAEIYNTGNGTARVDYKLAYVDDL